MDWWIWVTVGFVLLAVEVVTPGGFYAVFFGLSALAVGLLAGLGAAGPLWLQGILFGTLAVGALALFRPVLTKHLRSAADTVTVDDLVGSVARVREPVPADGSGKVELRGSVWTARNAGTEGILADCECRVERVDGLTLWVREA